MKQAVVLCAGRGSRLGERTQTIPKALLPIAGKPLIHRIVEKISHAGFSDIVLIVGYLGDMIEQSCRGFSNARCVRQESPKGTADAIITAAAILEPAFLLTYGDLWISARDYAGIAHLHDQNPIQRMGIVEMDRPHGAAVYIKGEDVQNIVEKPSWNGPADTHWNASGLFILHRDILDDCRRVDLSIRGELELASALQLAIQRGSCFGYYRLQDQAVDLGVPERYDALCEIAGHAEHFKLIYGYSHQYVGYAPGRVTIIGAHMDYNGGPVICAALPIGTIVSVGANSQGALRIASEQQETTATISPGQFAMDEKLKWTRYIVGVLTELGLMPCSLDIYISSQLPMGCGLASSAALTGATAMACLQMLGKQQEMDLADLCQRVEHLYLGAHCGILDPYIAINAREGRLLHIDCAQRQHRYLGFPEDLSIVVCDSGISRELAVSAYNARQTECLQLARDLGKSWLAELSADEARDLADSHSPAAVRRAMHITNEVKRVNAFKQALASGDYNALQTIMSQAHASCRDLFECSIPELDCLVQIANGTPGCVGARLTGAGWGGATVNLVQRDRINDFRAHVGSAYRSQTGRTASFLVAPNPGASAFGVTQPICP